MKTIFLTLAIITSIHSFGQNNSMVLIPETEYIMGKNTAYPSDWSPAHKVQVDSFLIDKYEVTNKEYLAFCQATGRLTARILGNRVVRSGPEFPDYPVVGVSLFDARNTQNRQENVSQPKLNGNVPPEADLQRKFSGEPDRFNNCKLWQ